MPSRSASRGSTRSSARGLILLLDQVTDPHNVGAVMRSCGAFGVTALVTTSRHSPEASGVLFKAASGAYEHVPFVKVTNLARAIAELKEYGFFIMGLDSEAESTLRGRTRPLAACSCSWRRGQGIAATHSRDLRCLARLDIPGAIKASTSPMRRRSGSMR